MKKEKKKGERKSILIGSNAFQLGGLTIPRVLKIAINLKLEFKLNGNNGGGKGK